MNIFKLAWRNSFRKLIRFWLTTASVAVAYFLLSSLSAVDYGLQSMTQSNNVHRLITSHSISITRSLPTKYKQNILSLADVKEVSYASWFGGFYQNEQQQLAVTAVESESYFSIFDEFLLTKEALERWQNNRTGLIIGKAVAEKYQWEIGDKVPLSSSLWMNKSGSFSWEFEVSAIYETKNNSGDNSRIFFQHEYFDQARAYAGYSLSWLSTQIKVNANTAHVAQQIDGLFENSAHMTRTISEQMFVQQQAQQFSDMTKIIKIVASAVFFILLLIVCNTMLQVQNERIHESALMKTLGFSSNFIINLLYLESLFLLGLGAFIGVSGAQVLVLYIPSWVSDVLPNIQLPYSFIVVAILVTFSAAIVCTVFPAIKIKQIKISEALGAKA